MENSNLSFLIWYKVMSLMSATKKGFSAKETQKQLGLKRYEPVRVIMFKLRKAMVKSNEKYTLEGIIEMGGGYFLLNLVKSNRKKEFEEEVL